MAVRFVIGRSGSGKSLHCFNAIVEMLRQDPLGPPIYWVVPKQETFSAERDLTCGSGLGGFCRARVASFELLGEEILAECGGTAIPLITQLGRQMIIGHLLRKHGGELQYYASAAMQSGLAAELDATFSEFERCGRDASDLAQLIEELSSTPDPSTDVASLIAKLSDLKLLYERYSQFLGQERLDPHRRLEQVLSSLASCRRVQGATVFVDGFLEFTDHERRMLAGLAMARREMTITLLMDPASSLLSNPHQNPDELSLFYRTEDTYRRLWFALSEAGVKPEPPTRLKNVARFEDNALKQIEARFGSNRPVTSKSHGNIELIETASRRDEVDAAARQVRKYIDHGLRLRDIAILMRDLDDYHALIDASFLEHGIPYFVDRRRSAVHHPLLQFTRSLLQIVLHGWPHDAVMTLLKTELAGVSRDQVDELENYVIEHRIQGTAWCDAKPWSFRRKLTRASEDEPLAAERDRAPQMDAMRRSVAEKIAPLMALLQSSEAIAVCDVIRELFATFERFNLRVTLGQWIKLAREQSRDEEAGEHEQVWSELIALLDQMSDVLGEQKLSALAFVEVLETGLERFDLALTPVTVDQVLIGTVDRTRGARPKAVILLGMNDSQFPRVPRDGSILSDTERGALRQHNLELDPDSERQLLDEQLLGYVALTRASSYMCLTRAIADDEARPQAPSPFWTRLRQQFPALAAVQVPRSCGSSIDCIGTPRQLITALMHWVRNGKLDDRSSPWLALYQWLATHDCCNDAIDVMRYRAWRALSYVNDASIAKQTAQALFGSPLSAGVSQIETFATCPFKHFVRYGLKLEKRDEEDVTAIDLGNVCHGILEKLVRQMLEQKTGWDTAAPEQRKKVVQNLAEQIGHELRGELMFSSARNQYILQHIQRTIDQVVDAQAAAGRRGKLAPWRAELSFGGNTKLGPLVMKTPAGHELRLRGKIDRVDFLSDECAFAVIDYKYRGDSLALDRVYHGLSLQLLTYLLVLQRNGSELAKRKLTPVAAFYVQLLRKLEKVDHPDEAISPDDPKFHLAVKPRGIVDFSHKHLIDAEHTSKMSDVVQLFLKTDGSLGLKNSCDGCEGVEFAAMLQMAERKLAELTDQILSGEVDVTPYRIGLVSPCARCDYRSVCRFDPAINRYHVLNGMKREDVLAKALEEAGDGK